MISTTSMHVLAPVWLFFDSSINDEEIGKKKARYQLCPRTKYLSINNSDTSNLYSHIINIYKMNIPDVASSKAETLVKWIVKDSLPFVTVESESFYKLFEVIRKLECDITVPFART
ncbi:6121_t:CDS:2, partial [Racocetra persica]